MFVNCTKWNFLKCINCTFADDANQMVAIFLWIDTMKWAFFEGRLCISPVFTE